MFKKTLLAVSVGLVFSLSGCGGGSGGSSSSTDTIAPIITLTGDNPVIIQLNSTYTEAGAIANDNIDGESSASPSGSVNTAIAGDYTVTYSATDDAGNIAIEVTRIVTVQVAPIPEKDLTSEYFYSTSDLGTTTNIDGSSQTSSYDENTKEYKIISYNVSSHKDHEVIFKTTEQGFGIVKEVVYVDKNDIYTWANNEMSPGAVEETQTFSPVAILVPYGNVGDSFTLHNQEKLSIPDSLDSIPAGTCGGPRNTLTEWEFIEQDREIEILKKETLTINNEQVETVKIKILMTEYNKPKYPTCEEKNTLNPEPLYLWLAKGKGIVKVVSSD